MSYQNYIVNIYKIINIIYIIIYVIIVDKIKCTVLSSAPSTVITPPIGGKYTERERIAHQLVGYGENY